MLSILYLIFFYYATLIHFRYVWGLSTEFSFYSRTTALIVMSVGYVFIYVPLTYLSLRHLHRESSKLVK